MIEIQKKGESQMKKMICVLLSLILVLSLAACGAGESKKEDRKTDKDYYSSLVKNLVKSMQDADGEKLLSLFHKEAVEIMCESSFDGDHESMAASLEATMRESMEDWERQYGRNIKLSHKIITAVKFEEENIRELQDQYHDFMNLNLEIKKAYAVQVEMHVEGEDGENTYDTGLIAMKVDGKWYVDIISFGL